MLNLQCKKKRIQSKENTEKKELTRKFKFTQCCWSVNNAKFE